MLKTRGLDDGHWDNVLQELLHFIRSLLCTSTDVTLHDQFFTFHRCLLFGRSFPSWLLDAGKVLLRKHVRNKNEPICEEVELLHANPNHAVVRFRNGRESTVSITDLAPSPSRGNLSLPRPLSQENCPSNNTPIDCPSPSTQPNAEEISRN